MKKLFDENGNKIPNEDIAYLAFKAVEQVRREESEKLYMRIIELANKVAESPIQFGREQAVQVVMMVEKHEKYLLFKDRL